MAQPPNAHTRARTAPRPMAINRWTQRRELLTIGVSSCDQPATEATPATAYRARDSDAFAYLCPKQIVSPWTRIETKGESPRIDSGKAGDWEAFPYNQTANNDCNATDNAEPCLGLECRSMRPQQGPECPAGWGPPALHPGGENRDNPRLNGGFLQGIPDDWGDDSTAPVLIDDAAGACPPSFPRAPRSGPGPRWCGRLGPSLFMTAVERRDQQERGRRDLERMGRHSLRLLGLTAEERSRNDLPPRQGLQEALAAPSGRFADLLAQGLQEGAEKGDAATRRHCLGRLGRPGSDGLDPGAKSAHCPQDHGWKGLTAAGRRSIRDAGALMDEHRGTLGFWTVTLPEDAAAVATREQIATFQSRLLFFARRLMIRRGLEPLALLVCELHPRRRAMDGARVPHWHLIVRVTDQPFTRWRAGVADWHRVVDAAHRAAFGWPRGHAKGCRMLPQKTGAARYLAPYMAKDRSHVEELQGKQIGRMVPRQWWSWTGELRAMVAACRVRPPSAFLGWCCRWWRELVDLGELQRSELIQIGEAGATVGRWFVWTDEEALDRAIERWIGEELARLDLLRSG